MLSALVPGLGQFYNHQNKKGYIMVGVEAGIWIAYFVFDAMQSTIARQKLAAYPPDLVINIPRDAARTFDIDRAAEMIEFGREAAEEALDNL